MAISWWFECFLGKKITVTCLKAKHINFNIENPLYIRPTPHHQKCTVNNICVYIYTSGDIHMNDVDILILHWLLIRQAHDLWCAMGRLTHHTILYRGCHLIWCHLSQSSMRSHGLLLKPAQYHEMVLSSGSRSIWCMYPLLLIIFPFLKGKKHYISIIMHYVIVFEP